MRDVLLIDIIDPGLDDVAEAGPVIASEEGAMVIVDIVVAVGDDLDEETVVGTSRDDKRLGGGLGGGDTDKIVARHIGHEGEAGWRLVALMATEAAEPLENGRIDSPEAGDIERADIDDDGDIGVVALGDGVGEDGGLTLTEDIGHGDLDGRDSEGDTAQGEGIGQLVVGRGERYILLNERILALAIVAGEDGHEGIVPIVETRDGGDKMNREVLRTVDMDGVVDMSVVASEEHHRREKSRGDEF